MIRNNIKSKKGFTIIEVVLVLAIAGLIFLMVFIAFPALQRGQRDTQRRDDMARFASQLAQYQANNYSKVPSGAAGWNDFISRYLRGDGDVFADPSGVPYHVRTTDGKLKEVDGTEIDVSSYDNIGGDAITSCSSDADCTQKSTSDSPANAIIRIYTNATCSGENPVYKKGDKYIAFTYKLEGAGIYCGHN
ncbi:type II secretion system protein [Candidatus Saccharibacteria bacterium]|nr:type II secretion system protein [Candidatus Saccharibacteria bacterium]